MKKLLMTFSFALLLFSSCQEKSKENVNVYTDKNLIMLMQNISEVYEKKNQNIKINIFTEKPKSFQNLDIVISSNDDIFKIEEIVDSESANNKKSTEEIKTETVDYKELFLEKDIFATDNIVLVGRKKINELREILYSSIAVPNYENTVGKIFADGLANLDFINSISKNIEYTVDTISALQSVDLYEVDYAIINSIALQNVKNAELCYFFDELRKEIEIKEDDDIILEKEDSITYNRFLRNESSEIIINFYNFLAEDSVKIIIEKAKNIAD